MVFSFRHNLPAQARMALLGFLVSICVVLGLIAGHLLYNRYDTTRNAEQHLQSAALSYAALADHNLIEASQFLTETSNIITTSSAANFPKVPLGKMVEFRRRTSPQMAGLLVMDNKGALKFGKKLWNETPVEITELLQKILGTKRASLASQPFAATDGRWLWPMARGIDNSANEIAIVLIDISGFLKEARTLAGNENFLVGLTTPNRSKVLVDFKSTQLLPLDKLDLKLDGAPQPGHDKSVTYQKVGNQSPYQDLRGAWLVAAKQLDDEPIYMVLAQQKSVWLAGWLRQMIMLTLIGTLITLLLGFVTLSSVRQAFTQARVQRDLAKTRERYDLAVSGVEDGIWDWDLESNEIYFSPVWFRILGYSPDELPSETATWSSSVHAEDLDIAHQKLQAHLDGLSPLFHDRHRMRCKDGSYIWIEARARAVRNFGGRPVRMVGTIVNVEREKQHEIALQNALRAAEAASRSKTRFLANMSHELRTPLNGIMGFAEITRDQLFGPVGSAKYVEYANDIHTGALHLLNLINDILDFSKIDAGKYQVNPVRLDPIDTIESTMRMVRAMAADRNVQLKFPRPQNMPKMYADERALRQMLLNLISNAIKFSKVNSVVLIEAGQDNADGIFIRVTDSGIGIPMKDQDRIFEPFEQVDDILTRQHEGTGLGLPLVKALIELHGGSVELVSEVGMGTGITLHFPPPAVFEDALRRSA